MLCKMDLIQSLPPGGLDYTVAHTEYTPDAVEDTGSGDGEHEFVDRDTYKSEMPSGTIVVKEHIADKSFMDMKVHTTDKATVSNQGFLVKALLGGDAKSFVTKDIFPRRDLYESEKGQKRVLIWNNLGKVTPGAIKAVVYSQEDGAYVISGYVDDKGTAVFTDLILRQASTVTVVI